MLADTAALALKIFYTFSCPDRQKIREAIYGESLKSLTKQAIEDHLVHCIECAYETLPPQQAA